MAPSLGKYLNKTILVSIPPLSGDVKCRPYKLTGVELIGLWLEGADLARDFLASEHNSPAPTTWAFFVPYSQIACVAIGTTPAVIPASGGTATATQAPVPAQSAPATAVAKPSPTSNTSSQKKSKNKER